MNNNIEILAPAGAFPQLEAAVKCGADAVYFGASGFNARRNAANFSDSEFIEAVRYCHKRGVKTYITLNTLIKDTETAELDKTLRLIASSGADAVIVQDMAVVQRVRKCCPTLPLHASTQMAVHNLSGARLLEKMGFSRVVLARELSVAEMKKIISGINIEAEVFVHGAHCMSASGMCYMSSALGGRSGNRGLCAQPCRLNFRTGRRQYALSLKDMCLADMTDELIDAGVTSFKIEGRMKRPEYTAAAVKAYKDAVHGDKPDIETLRSVFSRSGFTDGYAKGRRDLSMFGYRTKEDVQSADDVLPALAALYNNEKPLIGVKMDFSVSAGKPAVLEFKCGDSSVTVQGPVPEKARKLPLTSEMAEKSLDKLGSTYFYAEKTVCHIEDGLMLRAADINAMRREAAEKTDEKRGMIKPHEYIPFENSMVLSSSCASEPEMRLMFRKASQIPDDVSAERIILPIKEIEKDPSLISRFGDKLCAALPALIYPMKEEFYYNMLLSVKQKGVRYVYCENIGAVEMGKRAGMKLMGGALLNILNSEALGVYENLGVEDCTISTELSFRNIRNLKGRGRRGIIIYGYMPLMHFRCCPMQTEKGCAGCSGENELTDRIGEKLTVLCADKNYSVLHNSVPLYVGDKNLPPVSFVTLEFTKESRDEVSRIIDICRHKNSLPGRKTAGLYDKELL